MSIKNLNSDTSIPLKVILPIITSIIMTTFWVNTTLNRIETSLHDSWHIKDMQRWTNMMRDNNPTIKIPSPYDALMANGVTTPPAKVAAQ